MLTSLWQNPLMWMLPLYLHINKKSGDDDDQMCIPVYLYGENVDTGKSFSQNVLKTNG